MGFIENLQNLLDEKKLNVSQLAELTGIPKTTLYTIISRNSTRIDFRILEKIAETFSVTIEDLIIDTDELTQEDQEYIQRLATLKSFFDSIDMIVAVDLVKSGKHVLFDSENGTKFNDLTLDDLDLIRLDGVDYIRHRVYRELSKSKESVELKSFDDSHTKKESLDSK